jgi:tRNA pseudouridine55 synthase
MILNVYKPRNFTSFDVVAKVRKQLNTKHVGHAGTLDPLAEGVLVVLTGDDTKKQDEIMKQTKVYEAQITFGGESPTLDMEMKPVVRRIPSVAEIEKNLPELFAKYTGEFDQLIPDYSAKKIYGVPMYEYARKGKEIKTDQPLTKKVLIDEIKLIKIGDHAVECDDGTHKLPFAEIKVTCSHGTYIRALARDFGNDLDCGAVLSRLLRVKVGNYSIENALPLDNIGNTPTTSSKF